MIGEEDLPTVPYPTRSILINGLDPTINVQELKQAFAQYGEIVVRLFVYLNKCCIKF